MIEVGSIVQVKPDSAADKFRGCFITVTEVRDWGIQGYAGCPGETGVAYVRLANGEFEDTGGHAVFMIEL